MMQRDTQEEAMAQGKANDPKFISSSEILMELAQR